MTRIKQLRESLGKDQKVLAIDLSVTQPTISDWENGRKKPSIENCERLADYFGVSIDFLIGRTDIQSYAQCSADLLEIDFFSVLHHCCTQYQKDFSVISSYFLSKERTASLHLVALHQGLKLDDRIFLENFFGVHPLEDVLSSCGYDSLKILPLTMSRNEVHFIQLYRQLPSSSLKGKALSYMEGLLSVSDSDSAEQFSDNSNAV